MKCIMPTKISAVSPDGKRILCIRSRRMEAQADIKKKLHLKLSRAAQDMRK